MMHSCRLSFPKLVKSKNDAVVKIVAGRPKRVWYMSSSQFTLGLLVA